MDIPYEIDTAALSDRWAEAANMDSWSQLVVKHTYKTLELATAVPASGIWEMKNNGNIKEKSRTKIQNVENVRKLRKVAAASSIFSFKCS